MMGKKNISFLLKQLRHGLSKDNLLLMPLNDSSLLKIFYQDRVIATVSIELGKRTAVISIDAIIIYNLTKYDELVFSHLKNDEELTGLFQKRKLNFEGDNLSIKICFIYKTNDHFLSEASVDILSELNTSLKLMIILDSKYREYLSLQIN